MTGSARRYSDAESLDIRSAKARSSIVPLPRRA
jgi:hypothetical protein